MNETRNLKKLVYLKGQKHNFEYDKAHHVLISYKFSLKLFNDLRKADYYYYIIIIAIEIIF